MNKTKKGNSVSVPTTVGTRDISHISRLASNVYEAIAIISKRANQISAREKEELHSKLAEFASTTDNLEEIFENREQIEISRFYERQPKATLVAIEEFLIDGIYHRFPDVEIDHDEASRKDNEKEKEQEMVKAKERKEEEEKVKDKEKDELKTKKEETEKVKDMEKDEVKTKKEKTEKVKDVKKDEVKKKEKDKKKTKAKKGKEKK